MGNRVIFNGPNMPRTESAHLAGVFRGWGDVASVTPETGDALIRLGYATPFNAAMSAAPRSVSMHAGDVACKDAPSKKAVGLWVVTPTKGGRPADLDRTIAALALEAGANVTINVVLDGECAETERVLGWWAAHLAGKPCTFKVHTCGVGNPNSARDVAIRKAPADAVIVEVDDHDEPVPCALARIAAAFQSDATQAVYADHYVVDRTNRLMRVERLDDFTPHCFQTFAPSRGIRAFRKSLYMAVGGYRRDEYPAGDFWLWLRFAEYCNQDAAAFVHIADPLARFKVCENSISLSESGAQARSCERAVLAAISGTLLPRMADGNGEPPLPDYGNVQSERIGDPAPYRGAIIVVPCCKSQRHVPKLLASMTEPERRTVVLVSNGDGRYDVDACQIVLGENTGFAHACNVGARSCDCRYVCYLNADVECKPGWLDALIDEIENQPGTGMVGGRQYDGRGKIHSCGSVWDYGTQHFEHVIRHQTPGNQSEWTQARDVDAITASCILMPRGVVDQVGGFDERYRIGYWEDSDLCMAVRNAGYRIRFTPASEVVHHHGHSGRCNHEFYKQNAALCKGRWIESGLVDKFARQRGERPHGGDVVACYIALNEAEYIAASIESVYDFADRIIVVEGGNDYAVGAGMCGPDKRSTDGTIEAVKAVADPQGKIELISGQWANKEEQRNAYASRLKPGDWMILVDADEVFYEAGLWRLSALMHQHDVISPGFDLFWNNFQTVARGVWDRFPQIKAVKWQEGYRYRDHNCPCDKDGALISRHVFKTSERLYAHYAWVKPIEKLRQKAAYYERQPGARERIRPQYMDKVFIPWRTDPDRVITMFGSHPFGDGTAEPFMGRHPEPMDRRIRNGEYVWE